MKLLRDSAFILFCLVLLAGCAGNNNGQTEIIRKVKIEPVQQTDALVVSEFHGKRAGGCRNAGGFHD